ncbi:MAG: hypothetical protein OXD42_02470 [Rhodospirillaceae bacterium]|nr:hypothetical protein [Rhodospirillaceae bacterium]
MICLCRLPPIDTAQRIPRFVLTELPEGLPEAHTPPAVDTLFNRGGDALCSDQERR